MNLVAILGAETPTEWTAARVAAVVVIGLIALIVGAIRVWRFLTVNPDMTMDKPVEDEVKELLEDMRSADDDRDGRFWWK